jgi:hypothetical protein
MTATQHANTTSTQQLRIQNGSMGGGTDLSWSITEAASDCSTPSDLSWVSISTASGTTAPGGRSSVTVTFNSAGLKVPSSVTGKLCVASNDTTKPVVAVPLSLATIYNFQGFFGSVKNPPAINVVNAGSQVSMLFSLSGNQGLNIFADGSPSSVEIDCNSGAPVGTPETALSGGGGNGLSYSGLNDRYTYRWRTQGDWAAGSCREFSMRLNDGSLHRALFRFK